MISIDLNKSLYPLEAVREAIKAYEGIAKFSFRLDKRYIKLTLDGVNKDFESEIKDEFCNYVLYLIKSV